MTKKHRKQMWKDRGIISLKDEYVGVGGDNMGHGG